mmetsp:Transcript_19088/g.28084  ORF Transcript_19088/g.28084 Transcript_19088/m.28084 type:complete len:80 (+) Transcript_19088:77-316(+)
MKFFLLIIAILQFASVTSLVIEILKSQLLHERRNQPKFLDNDILNGEKAEKFMARRRKITSKMTGGSPPTKERVFYHHL